MTVLRFWTDLGARLEGDRVARFVDVDAEARSFAAADRAALVPLTAVAALRATGPDRVPFLQGQLSNDINGVPAGGCQRTLQLNVRGQVVAEATLCRREDDVFVAVEDGRGPIVLRSLADHVVFDDVKIEDLSARIASLTVQGGAAIAIVEQALGPVPEQGRFAQHAFDGSDVMVLRHARSGFGGVDVHLLVEALPGVVGALRAAGAELAGERSLTRARVLAGIPAAAAEAAAAVLPQESGLEPYVSYRKGCYLGQEIMARIEARGNLRRGLVRLRLEGSRDDVEALEDADDSAIRLDERTVGVLGSAAYDPEVGGVALAVARRDLPQGAELRIGNVVARIVETHADVAVQPGGALPDGL